MPETAGVHRAAKNVVATRMTASAWKGIHNCVNLTNATFRGWCVRLVGCCAKVAWCVGFRLLALGLRCVTLRLYQLLPRTSASPTARMPCVSTLIGAWC